MPRPSKGPRLHLRRDRGRDPVYIIKDNGRRISTGSADRRVAEKALAQYLSEKTRPCGPSGPEELTIAQALTIYAQDHTPETAAPERTGYALAALDRFWGDHPVSYVKASTCRRYSAERGVSAGTVRRELVVLRAALNFCAKEGYLTSAPPVTLPAPPPPNDRWLTRQEAAWLLRAARSLRKDGRHLARFILVGLYTGTRKTAILQLRIDQPSTTGGYVDTTNGVMYRQPQGRSQTKKRQPPAKLGRRLLSHIKRWKANGARFVVEDCNGNRLGDIRKGWSHATELAAKLAHQKDVQIDLSDCTPHVLRHTCATWTMQGGADVWAASGRLGMSVETLEKVYGHHHPSHQESAVAALESGHFGPRGPKLEKRMGV